MPPRINMGIEAGSGRHCPELNVSQGLTGSDYELVPRNPIALVRFATKFLVRICNDKGNLFAILTACPLQLCAAITVTAQMTRSSG